VCVCSAVAVLTTSLLITLVNPTTGDCIRETRMHRVIYAYVLAIDVPGSYVEKVNCLTMTMEVCVYCADILRRLLSSAQKTQVCFVGEVEGIDMP